MKSLAFGLAIASGLFAIFFAYLRPEAAQAYALSSIAVSLIVLAFGKFKP